MSYKLRSVVVLSVLVPTAVAGQPISRVSTTTADQVIVELSPGDGAEPHLFDLNGRSLVFTPDGHGRYSRDVRPLAWEADIGEPVPDRAEVVIESFEFDFAGRRWASLYVSKHGALTLGEPLTYEYWGQNWFATMREHANRFVSAPTISPLYKPILGGQDGETSEAGQQHVSASPERIVVTWTAREPFFYVHAPGFPPQAPARFQAVLRADGSIAFNYEDVTLGDGIVGLFTVAELTRGEIVASLADGRDPELPGHLDLLDTTIYATNTDAVILEFTTREPIPDPPDGTVYSYRLYFDTDEPYWVRVGDGSDMDFLWMLERGGEDRTTGGVPYRTHGRRIALLADIGDLAGLSAEAFADAAQFDDDRFVRGGTYGPMRVELPPAASMTDLSEPDARFNSARDHREVFSFRGVPNLEVVACRVIDVLGDKFDLFVFHNEFRIDTQVSASPWKRYANGAERGIGDRGHHDAPCGGGRRLKGLWERPVWVYALHEEGGFERGRSLFVHEFTHTWAAYLSYERSGRREPLFDDGCGCHWRTDLHTAAAFSRSGTEAMSVMGGRFWQDNGDGTFTPKTNYGSGGLSWFDLYAMGLAEVDEVPDTFILRELEVVEEVATTWPDGLDGGIYRGRKEIVSIEQVIAAEGLREPSLPAAQTSFNAAFVYLVERGQTPNADLLRLHEAYRDKVIEHWARVTGHRSRITTATAIRQ